MPPAPLRPEQLSRCCDLAALGFEDTQDISALDTVLGQERAIDAMEFGVRMGHEG